MTGRRVLLFLLLLMCVLGTSVLLGEEGMWPMSEIHKLNLSDRGLKIDATTIYNPGEISLIDGICKINGCTGSFVSSDGLILTNHHCAFRAVQAASTAEHDYLTNGFLADKRSEEIPAVSYTVRITESYRDVSQDVLSVAAENMDPMERTKAIEKRIKEIIVAEEKAHPGKRAEVAEMFIGKTYVLFLFTYLKDLRLVYVPPISIGNFGGETDNWVWPRHTGDFSFMRAYVGPDGAPAEYSPENVPYHPRKVLKVAPGGVAEGDAIFIFGYPGRTYRHRTSYFLEYESSIHMPYVVGWYGWQIDIMEKMCRENRDLNILLSSRIKGLSNTYKNYRGKLRGIRGLGLLEKKRKEEQALQTFIMSDATRSKKYGTILGQIKEIYGEKRAAAQRELLLKYLKRSPVMMRLAYTVVEAAMERQKPDVERESAYMDRNFPLTQKRLQLTAKNFHEATDKIILKALLLRAAQLPQGQRIDPIDAFLGAGDPESAIDKFMNDAYGRTHLNEENVLKNAFSKTADDLQNLDNPFIRLAGALYPEYQKVKDIQKGRKGSLDRLHAELLEVKKAFMGKDFIPDANGTLRLTFGRIKGYSPRDAVFYRPITTLRGVMEKDTGQDPFIVPLKLRELYEAGDFGRFNPPGIDSVPVAILYDADTTGGSSGSPVFNARGELVGANFDRAWEATVNDFEWNKDISRSIAVDIRYVLWITLKFAGADSLLEEMGVVIE